MDEEPSLIDTKTRNEKIKNFFIDNKNILITSLIIITILLISFFGFKEYKNTKKKQISEKFNSVILDYSNGNFVSIKERLELIINEKDSTYSPLSLYFLIDNDLIESREDVNELFNILINKTSLEDEIKFLIIYKKALYNADFVKENELLEILKPVINSESVWKSHALYLIAEYFYSKGEKQKSKDFFSKITSIENANEDIVKEVQKRLSRDFGE